MLSIDLAEISYEECVFIARLATIVIDIFNPLIQSSPNQLFRDIRAIEISTLRTFKIRIDTRKTWCCFNGGDRGRWHILE